MEIEIVESVRIGTRPLEVDEATQVIRGVKVIGQVSKNGKVFPEATRRSAHRLVEGLKVNIDHKRRGEDVVVRSRFGVLRNPREARGDETPGCYADLHYLKSHPMTPTIIEMARLYPDMAGFSILGQGRGKSRDKEGRVIVEAIENLESADLVADPANVAGLNESVKTTAIREAGAVEQEVASVEECLGKLVAACLAQGEHDMAGDHMKVHKKHSLKGGEKKDGDEEEEGGEETKESAAVRAERLRADCVALCESHKVAPAGGLVAALMAVPEDSRDAVVTAWRGKPKAPKSGSPSHGPGPGPGGVGGGGGDGGARPGLRPADLEKLEFDRILEQLRS